MEWLINRRRMMFNKAVPPAYMTFEDAAVWEIICCSFGDFEEVVVTDNGNNTVDITTSFVSMNNSSEKKREVLSTQTNVDNSGGTYTAGTTKTAVGITLKQCQAVTFGFGDFFANNQDIKKFNEFQYFTSVTTLNGSAFSSSTLEEITLPSSLVSFYGNYQFRSTPLTYLEFPEGFTSCPSQQTIWGCSNLQLLVFPTTITSMNRYCMTKGTVSTNATTVIVKATNPPVLSSSIPYSQSIGAVYVPNDSVDTYKTASYWSDIASKIYSINDYNPT